MCLEHRKNKKQSVGEGEANKDLCCSVYKETGDVAITN